MGNARADTVQRLRAQLERVEGRRMDAPMLPVHPALAGLLPGGGLRPGGAYALGPSTSLLFALMSRPSRQGAWCGVIGVPGLGAEAAEAAGVELSRLVLIPEPGDRWLTVTATVAEVLPLVVVRPPARAANTEVTRLAARLRDRGAVLLVQGAWPQVEATIHVDEPRWTGLGEGYGLLEERELTVTVSSRRFPAPRRARLALPDPLGTVAIREPQATTPRLRAVG